MSIRRLWVAMLCLAAALGFAADAEQRIVQDVLALPTTHMGPAHEAFRVLAEKPDILQVLGRAFPPLDEQQQEHVISFLLRLGWKGVQRAGRARRQGSLTDLNVVQVLVSSLEHAKPGSRNRILGILATQCSDDVVRQFGKQITEFVAHRRGPDAALLGMTGCDGARRYLEANPDVRDRTGRAYDLALAKLGDTEKERQFLEEFRRAKDTQARAELARDLGYIATPGAIVTLSLHLRSAETISRPPFGKEPLRRHIAEALERAMPLNDVFWPPEGTARLTDSYYQTIERWATETLGIRWKGERGELPLSEPTEIPPSIRR